MGEVAVTMGCCLPRELVALAAGAHERARDSDLRGREDVVEAPVREEARPQARHAQLRIGPSLSGGAFGFA